MTAGTRKPAANAVLKVPLSKAELAATKQTVCVTGAAGYIAAHILQRLLAAGHTGVALGRRLQPSSSGSGRSLSADAGATQSATRPSAATALTPHARPHC